MTTCTSTVAKQETPAPVAGERTGAERVFRPRSDIVENADAIILTADLPGVDENSLDITLEKNVLTIRGTVGRGAPVGYRRTYAEYDVGNFERVFSLSDEIDRDGIEAVIRDGVLRLRLPKSHHARSKKIAVKAG